LLRNDGAVDAGGAQAYCQAVDAAAARIEDLVRSLTEQGVSEEQARLIATERWLDIPLDAHGRPMPITDHQP
jgi:hypothetical protein